MRIEDLRFVAHTCADCDPAIADEPEYEQAYTLLIPKGLEAPEECPQCGSFRGIIDHHGEYVARRNKEG